MFYTGNTPKGSLQINPSGPASSKMTMLEVFASVEIDKEEIYPVTISEIASEKRVDTVRLKINSKKCFRGFLAPPHVGISSPTLFYLAHIDMTDQVKLIGSSDLTMRLRNNSASGGK